MEKKVRYYDPRTGRSGELILLELPEIPEKLSELENDEGFSKRLSELTNDAGFVTAAQAAAAAPVQSVNGATGAVDTWYAPGGSASTYPSTYGRFAVTANIFSNIQVEHYYGLLTIEAIGNYQRHMFESSWGEVWVGWRESSTVAEPTVWNKVAGGIGNSVRQVFASTDSAGWYRLAVMNDQITSAVIHLHATGWWEEDLYILIGRNYVSGANPPSITIFGNTYNTRATQFRLNEISSTETYLEAYITPTNAHQLTITPFLTGWNRAYAVPKALSSSTGTIYAAISHTAGDTIETSGKIAGALRPTSVAYANIDSIAETGFYLVTGTPGLLVHEQWDANYATQIFQKYTDNNGVLEFRVKSGGAWGAWRTALDNGHTLQSNNSLWSGSTYDLNNFYSGVVLCYSNVQHVPSADWWHVMASGQSGTCVQIAAKLFNTGAMMTRRCASGTWSAWEPLYDNGYKAGDTLTLSTSTFAAHFRAGAKMFEFTVPVQKSLESITSISCTTLTGWMFGVNGDCESSTSGGGYKNWKTTSYTVTATKRGNNLISVLIQKSSSAVFTNATNLTPAIFFCGSIVFSFS